MGSGFKTFTAASVLTAADLNNFCQNQSVMYFATTAARDVAITSPLDGMVAYIGSNDSSEGLYTYNGTSWRKGPGWNAPWGFVQYTQATADVVAINTNILVGNTLSVVNGRRYRIHAQIQSFKSNVVDDVAELCIVVGGTVIAGTRVSNPRVNYAGYGQSVHAYHTATATNATLSCNLFTVTVTGTLSTHTFGATATRPIFIAVEDIGPSGAPV